MKCCFIIPYFGKFPNYFRLFLESCRYNPSFNWLIFTDIIEDYSYPINVRVVHISFPDIVSIIKSKFDFDILIPTPYKLCDYKPAFGYIFQDYILDYEYWGHCDIDTIMGDLNRIVAPILSNDYDKIFCLGHMTIYRNTENINKVFMSTYRGVELYKSAFSTEEIVTFDEEWRDENNINQIFLDQGYKVFQKDLSYNPSRLFNSFRRTEYVGMKNAPDNRGYKIEPSNDTLVVWDSGHIYRYMIRNNALVSDEFAYIHLQNRKMRIMFDEYMPQKMKIIPDEFSLLENEHIAFSNFHNIKKKGFCIHTLRISFYNKIKRIKKMFSIWQNH